MAFTVCPDVDETLTLAAFLDLADDYDLATPEGVLRIAPLFAALNANRTLLLPHIARLLADPAHADVQTDYSGQTVVLADAPRFFIRANVWLPRSYPALQEYAASDQFFYDVPHDHNFTFLTACHRGSGYRTKIFEYDGRERVPAVGERVATTFLEERALHQGMLMVYRASRDIHVQYPPGDFSVTINLMTKNAHEQIRRQNIFDQTVTRVVEQPRGVEIAKRQLADVLAAASS